MPSKNHILDLDKLTGDEYIAGGAEVFSEEFFVQHWQETDFEKLYKQLEFASEFGNNLCTIYWPITTLSIMLGREISGPERKELVRNRTAQGDFDPAVGGFTSIGVDVARRWHNLLYPGDPIRTALVASPELLRKLAQKKIPIVTSLRGNREFTLDTIDWTMDQLDYWNYSGPRYGHCRTRRGLEVLDNYGNKYRYKSIDDLELCADKAFESKNVYVFFKESSLSDLGKRYLKGMQAGLWNGSRSDDMITRYEASRIALRIKAVPERTVWNGKGWDKKASIYEVTAMLSRVSDIPVYLGIDRNKEISRGEVIQLIYKAV